MKFLADANISDELVAMLRAQEHDGLSASEIPPQMHDIEVLRLAVLQDRVLLTSDKDFGELVFVHQLECPGVVLLRIALPQEAMRVARFRGVLPDVLSRLPGSYITVTTSGVRIRPIRELP